ncbi:MBL fold metallo-hydrolase [archaeon]|nr:MBL fold metallo-hydrolase [archaeon]MBT4647978.1 MBL fold metallo-hydrolase [archaeon]MBT6822643.1 MBL fold metallo-hydrolase [archaeon]
MITDVILKKNNKVKVIRVLLKFDVLLGKYPQFGVYSYMIDSDKGIYLIDCGPKYNSQLPFFRNKFKETNNIKLIKKAMNKYFPNKTIREIIFSHYHFDHSELAPEIQKYIKNKFGNTPLIRLHKNDYGKKKFMKIFPDSLIKYYKNAGYDTWKIGDFVKDKEPLIGTNFIIRHIPGHTTGTICFVNEKDKTIISGWWLDKNLKLAVKLVHKLIDEDPKALEEHKHKIKYEGFKYFYYHPMI